MAYSQFDLMEEVYNKSICRIRVDGTNAYFVNLADLHYGLNHRGLVKQWLDFMFSIPNLYIGLGGDAGNGVTRFSKGDVTEEWASGSKQLYALAEDLRQWVEAGRLLYIIKGNHMAGRMEDETYHTPEELLAWILGDPSLYKGSQVFVYFNVNKNCYIHFIQHKSPKKIDHFSWVNADVTWREHYHQNAWVEKLVIEHNKFVKKPAIKSVYEINSGHWQILPKFTTDSGIRPTPSGCWVAEMSGVMNGRDIKIWSNEQLLYMIKRGYRLDG